ncbi:MAG: SDR family NAD(P)-dependent oxidoreductase [Alphaproteobacteria bacterium]|nr:SDR family NAD(P)-dependent oxidoreductase [Alphaproteobacteria bacterium]NCQ67312.1 SDR family NAD(P)-dependent oxidoreductase [Alphaproteobacteria bacterium]NCT06721.1 SDR family NAD(P)-dependent oxidoreductase [Alphaproteobacteria bacterium]
MKVFVTGVAGFIGYHTSKALLDRGDEVVGIDSMNEYYDVTLKEARLKELEKEKGFTFIKGDIADRSCIEALFRKHKDIAGLINLAAQAGVRYSLIDPYAYVHANLTGFVTLLESAKALTELKHFVYASSSSVYGANKKKPSSVGDRIEKPISLYAATKASNELIARTYSHLFQIPTTGLRFFTVYGPWGRPDMAAFIFAKNILAGKKIDVYNQGKMRRNFTYIDDIVQGVLGALDKPAKAPSAGEPPFALYNIGNNRSEELTDFIHTLEEYIGCKAKINLMPLQPGDVKETIADIESTQKDLGFEPKTNMREGLKYFIDWYKEYYV